MSKMCFGLMFGEHDLGLLYEALTQYQPPANMPREEREALAALRQAIADALEATEE